MYRILKLKEAETPEAMQKIADKQMPDGGYRYIAPHAIGPGTLPEDVKLLKSEDGKDGKIAIYISRPLTSEELKKYDIKPEWIQEAEELGADEETEDIVDAEETEEDLEDTVDSEEGQDENPVEEESLLDQQLDEIREVLVDLDLRLYKIINDAEEFYILGRLDPVSNQVEMLVDTQPADNMNVDIEPDGTETAEQTIVDDKVNTIANNIDIATRFDYVTLPTKFEQIKDMFPRYGEDLTPDHEAIVEYLMNLLIEQNPRAAKERAEEESEPADTEEIPVEDEVVTQEELPGEEELEDEE